jgi:hypothetical protein
MRKLPVLVALLLGATAGFAGQGIRHGILDESYSGTVLVQSAGPNRVVVLIDSAEGNGPDGIVDLLFTVKSAQPIDPPISLLLEKARVGVEESRVVVSSQGEHTVVVLDHGAGCPELELSPRMTVRRFSGNELLRRSGNLNLPPLGALQVAQQDVAGFTPGQPSYVPWDDGLGGGTESCDSGGKGASSCTQSKCGNSCSVSCNSGYACCNCTFCDCKCTCK